MCRSTKQRPTHPTGPVSKELTGPGTSETDRQSQSSSGGQLVLNDSVRPQRTSLPSMQKQKNGARRYKECGSACSALYRLSRKSSSHCHVPKSLPTVSVSGEFQKKFTGGSYWSQACAVTMTTWSPDLAPATDTKVISHQIVSAGRISQAGGGFYRVNG